MKRLVVIVVALALLGIGAWLRQQDGDPSRSADGEASGDVSEAPIVDEPPSPAVVPLSPFGRLMRWRDDPPPNVPKNSPALWTYATLIDPDRSHDWHPRPGAPLKETINRLVSCGALFRFNVCDTAYSAIDALREQPDAVLDIIEPVLAEESVSAAVEEGADHSASRHLLVAGLLGTPRACAIVGQRVDDLFGLHGRLVERFIEERASIPRYLETDEGRALNGTITQIQRTISSALHGATVGSCPTLYTFCRARLEEWDVMYINSCSAYLAWVFPNERLPDPNHQTTWPDPPYWTPPD